MTEIIAISNQKGGVGKTTTAVNLSACLAALEKRVLLVDMDPQGNASQGMGINEVQDEDVYEALDMAEHPDRLSKEALAKLILSSEIDYLSLLPSSSSLAGMEIELVNAENRHYRLRHVLNVLKSEYDYIIIDSPPSLGLLTINILSASNKVIIPVQCEYYALQGLAELFNTIRMVQKNYNEDLEIMGALLTMFDKRLTLANQVVDEVNNCFSDKVFKTIINRNVKLGEAPSHGKPIILYDILCAGAKRYMELAQEVIAAEK